jgi:23S rRNA (pseudouridine1915-N3)-methyltransferase
VRELEAQRLLGQVGDREWVVALDERGKSWTTLQLAEKLDDWRMQGRDVAFLIGGADGLDEVCRVRADHVLALSAMTFPHALVRILLAEQLYRAWTVLSGHPYHRGC